MARQQRNPRLQTPDARRKLTVAHEPYWHELRRGLHIGYRKGPEGASWLLREYRDGRRWKRRVGKADDNLPADGVSVLTWEQVIAIAVAQERPTRTATKAYTLDDCLEDYWSHRRAKSTSVNVEIDKGRVTSLVNPSRGKKLGHRDCNTLTATELRKLRDSMIPDTDDPEKSRLAKVSANRNWSPLRAALNHAYDNGHIQSKSAWDRIKPFHGVDRPRTRFLSVAEAKRLLNVMPSDLRDLARAALYSGLRLGELLALRVCDVVDGQVHVRHSKTGKARMVPLSSDGCQHFDNVCAGKAGDASVFVRTDEAPWYGVAVTRGMQVACIAAKLAPPATFHDLRRSYASLLINAGTDAEIIRELLGHADLRMTLRTYAHLMNKTVATAVRKRLPSFGVEATNIVPFAVDATP